MPRNIYHITLARFLLLSLGLHLLLLSLGKSTNLAELHYLGQPAINVEIQNATRVVHSVKTASSSQAAEKDTNILSSVSRNEKYIPEAPQPSSLMENFQEYKQEPATPSESKLRNQLLGQLKTHLSRYLVYPPLARQRGWEGTVLLGLRVEANGHLEKIYVERSSGYAVLDYSALNSLNRLGHVAEVSAWLNGRAMDMQLPVIYRLLEN